MGIEAGLVGLPNVGKSTLFNVLTQSSVPAENYPFCTIDPHKAVTHVPDERLEKLKNVYKSERIIPATVSFVDIAGLVKGAASGEGLGNTFLSHIREVHLILHVVRCFEDPDIISTGNLLDPLEDYHTIVAELMLKDIETVQKRLEKVAHLIKGAKQKPAELKMLTQEQIILEKILSALNAGDHKTVSSLLAHHPLENVQLLSAKNFLVIANISESSIENNAYEQNAAYQKLVGYFGASKVIAISAKLEAELAQMTEKDAQDAMAMFGLKERGLNKVIEKTYQQLGLITFFTCGPKEIHAWPIKKGITIRQAAGEIHSDLERGFICAEVFNYQDLITYGSESAVKNVGKLRTEGQDYKVHDGDIVHVRFNV